MHNQSKSDKVVPLNTAGDAGHSHAQDTGNNPSEVAGASYAPLLLPVCAQTHMAIGTPVERCVHALAPTISLVVELAHQYFVQAKTFGTPSVPEMGWRTLWDILTTAAVLQLNVRQQNQDDGHDVVDM